MNANPPLAPARVADLLRQAAEQRWPLTLRGKITGRWCTYKSYVLGLDVEKGSLRIASPKLIDGGSRGLPPGLEVNVSFRRGGNKCLFNTRISAADAPRPLTAKPALNLRLPTQVFELQRRLYDRIPVPAGVSIPVRLHRKDPARRTVPPEPLCDGRMMDLSAGGLSMDVRGDDLPLDAGQPVLCSFPVSPVNPPVQIHGHLCRCKPLTGGRLRLGLQFVGLEASLAGQETLQHVVRLTSRLRLM